MIGKVVMQISKEEMMAIVEHYLNSHLLNTTFHSEHKAKVVDQIRKSGDHFIVTFEGQQPKKAERPKTLSDSDPSRSSTEANEGVAVPLQGAAIITHDTKAN